MNILTKALILIESIVFPTCCQICGKQSSKLMCKNCKKQIMNNAIFNVEYLNEGNHYFKEHDYIFLYKEDIRKLIIDYKFNDKSYLYKIFSEIIINNKKIYGNLKKYDIIIPVPIHKKRKRQRGYNQSELIAKEIAKKTKIKYEPKCLVKKINTKPQSLLNKNDRRRNIKNAYKINNKEKLQDKKIILFDDIYTTGSTVNECSRILIKNGAKEVLVLTLAKD